MVQQVTDCQTMVFSAPTSISSIQTYVEASPNTILDANHESKEENSTYFTDDSHTPTNLMPQALPYYYSVTSDSELITGNR